MALDLRYLAGFFDGEGTVGLYYDQQKRRWFACVEIWQNCNRASEHLFNEWARALDGRVYIQKRPGTGAVPTVRLRITKQSAITNFIRRVRRYTKLKTPQLLVLDEWLQANQFSLRNAQLLKALKRTQ